MSCPSNLYKVGYNVFSPPFPESEEEAEEPEERQQTPEAVADDSAAYYEQSVR